MRCGAHLTLSECYTPDLPLRFGRRSSWSCQIVEVLATQMKFLPPFCYCSIINWAFTFHKCFWLLPWRYFLFGIRKHKFSNQTTLYCSAFKSHTEWSNAQRVGVSTATILPMTVDTCHNLNYFAHKLPRKQILQFFKNLPSYRFSRNENSFVIYFYYDFFHLNFSCFLLINHSRPY